MTEAAPRVRRDGAALLLSGTLDRNAATTLWSQASAAVDGARVLDVTAVDAVDSAGLALLLEWIRQARTDGRAMSFTALPDKLLAIARLSGVDGLLTDGYSGVSSGTSPSASSSSASSR